MTHTICSHASHIYHQLLPHTARIIITLDLLLLLVLLLIANPPSVQAKATQQPDNARNSLHLLQHASIAPTARHTTLRDHIDEASYALAHEHSSLLLGAPAALGVIEDSAQQP